MAQIDIQQLIDYLEKATARARRLPGGKVMMDQNELSNLVEQMRMAIPFEIKQARQVLEEQQRVLSQARNESTQILHQAQTQAAQHLEDNTLVRQAEEQARLTLQEAREEAGAIINGADDYAEESLRQLAQSLVQLNSVIQNGIHALASRRSKRSQKPAAQAPNGTSVLDPAAAPELAAVRQRTS